jgi:fructokinase
VIVVAGDALVDLIIQADGSIEAVPGGGPYNSARAIGRLGMPVSWVGGLSTDRFGRALEAGLIAAGVDLSMAQRTELPTTLAMAEIGADGAAAYRFYSDSTSAPAVYPGPLSNGLPIDTAAVLTGTLGFVLEPMATTLEGMVAELAPQPLLMIDPNCRPSVTRDPDAFRARIARVLARADIVKVSTEDLAFLVPGVSLAEAINWVQGWGPRALLVTDGASPVRVLVEGTEHRVPAPTVEVIDTIGAGDTFGGAFLACLVQGGGGRHVAENPEAVLRAVRFAVRASAIVCGRPGANPPTLAELGGWPAR